MTNEKKLEYILNAVAEEWGVTVAQIQSKSRKREYVEPRQIYCKLAKKFTEMPFAAIGQTLEGRDHTTVLYSIQTINDLIETEPYLQRRFGLIYFKLLDELHPPVEPAKGITPTFPGVALLYRPYPKLMLQS
jgi:chromosomal replication initiation ATPase DnaA